MVLALLLGCDASSTETGPGTDRGDTADSADTGDALPPRECAAPRVTMRESWPWESLPATYDYKHTQNGAAVGDIDGDGWLDVIFAYGGGSAGYRNDGAGNLVYDAAIDADGGPLPSGQGAALADLDADGDLDLYIGRDRGWLAQILLNDGTGHFTGTEIPGSDNATMTGAFADFDGDLDLDLFIGATITDTDGTGVMSGEVTSGDGDQFLLQDDAGTFVEATDRLPPDDISGWTFQGSPIDYDLDGDLDLYLAHDWGAYIQPNRMLRNDGDARFTRDPDCACELVMYAMGAAVGDANDDTLPDLFVTDIGGPNLLINLGDATFADATLALGAVIPPEPDSLTSWSTTFVDLDQDAVMDLFAVHGQLGQPELIGDAAGPEGWEDGAIQYDQFLRGVGGGHFELQDVGFTDSDRKRGVAVGDFDRDGLPDMITTGKYFMRHWQSEGGCGAGVRVLLDGKGRNVHAIGARVEADVGGRTVTQWALPSTTFGSNAPELYFGVGTAHQIDAMRVTWPDGSTSEAGVARPGDTVQFDWR